MRVVLFDAQPVREALTNSAIANEWLEAAELHKPGVEDAPLRKIASWNAERLERTLDAVRQSKPSERLNDLLERGALLHADITLLSRDVRVPVRVDGWVSPTLAMLAKDGRDRGTGSLDPHTHFGRAFFRAMRAPIPWRVARTPGAQREVVRQWIAAREQNPRIRQWFRAVSAHFASRHWLADQVPHFDEARQLIPSDSALLFDSACFSEVIASAQVQRALPPWERPSQMKAMALTAVADALIVDEAFNLAEADRQYRELLAREPGHDEARVRLARVLSLKDRHAEAFALLQRGIKTSDPFTRYYGALALGWAAEGTERPDLARDAYERASALFPRAQSPLIALLRLARARSDGGAADEAASRLATLRWTERDRLDPWWGYFDCNGRNRGREVQYLWALFKKEGR